MISHSRRADFSLKRRRRWISRSRRGQKGWPIATNRTRITRVHNENVSPTDAGYTETGEREKSKRERKRGRR